MRSTRNTGAAKPKPLVLDPVSLGEKKQWARHSLAQHSRIQMNYEKKTASFERERKKAINQLRNSKSFYNKTLKQIQDRQMEICKSREKERLLIHSHFKYAQVPVLETKRFCGACAQRPKSALPGSQVAADTVTSCSCRRITFNSYEHCAQPPKLFVKRKTKSAGAAPSSVPSFAAPPVGGYGRSARTASGYRTDASRHLPSPVIPPESTSPRCISPMRSFDLSTIPDYSQAKLNMNCTRKSV